MAEVAARPAHERLSLHVPESARKRIDNLLRDLEITPGTPWVVIHPGATAPSRRYTPRSFASVARQLVREHGIRVLFTGSDQERELIESIRSAMGQPSDSLAGALDLSGLSALIERAPLLIANNTGPAHIAAAVGTPIVVLYALTNPQHTPWAVPSRVLYHEVPCSPCYRSVCPEEHHHCLRLVTPEEVVQAALELLAQAATAQALPPSQELAYVHARDQRGLS